MNSIMERWIASCGRELLDRTLVWNQRHLMTALRELEDHYKLPPPTPALNQAHRYTRSPENVIDLDLDQVRVRRRDRVGGILYECHHVA